MFGKFFSKQEKASENDSSSTTSTMTTTALSAASDTVNKKSISTNNNKDTSTNKNNIQPETMSDMDTRDNIAWLYSATAAMLPFSVFCFSHSRGVTVRVVEQIAKSRIGVYGLLALPFITLSMEKSIYDTVQAWQGLDPNITPKDRGGFPSGGAALPSFSLIPVQKKKSNKDNIDNEAAT